eukprot:TRINITY_DN23152_c0_g1_i1.p1 TRINITY_DN23152_c0_g1~~TRINITY_DN23152_c0_g1_i1.p1  ORF type:complete len:388 (-),score=62.12 TRINITY_DN23152_c0_g1_i1:12-1175(-)
MEVAVEDREVDVGDLSNSNVNHNAANPRLAFAAHVKLSDITPCLDEKTFNPQARAFTRSIQKLGFAYLQVPTEIQRQIRQCYNVAYRFFDTPSKRNYKMGTTRDVGYMDLLSTSGKEYIQMRHTEDPKFKWPDDPEEFKQVTAQFFKTFSQLTKYCMAALALGMGVNPDLFLQILDTDEQQANTENYWSSTIYRYFCYRNQNHSEEPCKIHTDIGLLTLIPVTKVPQLQILDTLTFDWLHVELAGDYRDELIVFGGETLEYLTSYYYQAPVHKVGYLGEAFATKGKELTADEEEAIAEEIDGHPFMIKRKKVLTEPRQSLVWLCRGRSDAVLDPQAINVERQGSESQHGEKATTVGEFMRKKYATKKSANGLSTKDQASPGFPSMNY